eukprot:7766415-Ditylum_brightwellii.AAC.1
MATGSMLVKQKNRKRRKEEKKKKHDVVALVNPGNILLPGILEDNIQVADVLLPDMPAFEDNIDSNSDIDTAVN